MGTMATRMDRRGAGVQGSEDPCLWACLNHYGLVEELRAGTVTYMYESMERVTGASLLVKP